MSGTNKRIGLQLSNFSISVSGLHTEIATETELFNVESTLKYKNYEPIPLLIEQDWLHVTVGEIKKSLLTLSLLDMVKESAKEITMYMIRGPVDNPNHIRMDDRQTFAYYNRDLSEDARFELVPNNVTYP